MEKLLIIGENPSNDPDFLNYIKREGFQILKARNKTDGLEILRADQPSIVIVDHHLENDDGLHVLKEVRQAEPKCEIILVTHGGEMEAAIEVLRSGGLDYLRLPIDIEQLHVAIGRARERRQQKMSVQPAVILVIEDHETTRNRLAKVLEKEGYQVFAAADGEEGIQLFKEKRVDLILADLRMPKKDGLSVLRDTKGNGADVEVIVVTGYGDEEIVVQALREGAVNFLKKPIDIEQMLLAVKKALDFQTIRRSLAYRNRDVELMQQLVVRLTSKLELVVETPDIIKPELREFLLQLINALPLGIVVAGSDRRIIFANNHVISKVGKVPEKLSTEWLGQVGIHNVSEEELDIAFSRMIQSKPGTIETMMVSQWAFLIMTHLKLVRPDLTERFVTLAIRGERKRPAESSPVTS